MRLQLVTLGLAAILAGSHQSGATAANVGRDPVSPKVGHHRHVAKGAAPKATAAAPPAVAPWAAVDPALAGVAAPAETAAVPGVRHVVQPDEDRVSYGMKWTSSNASSNQYSTQGVINEVNHDLGAPNTIGTDAEMGMKLHF